MPDEELPGALIPCQVVKGGKKASADDDRMGSLSSHDQRPKGTPGLQIRGPEPIDDSRGDVRHISEENHDMVIVSLHVGQACEDRRADAPIETGIFDDLQRRSRLAVPDLAPDLLSLESQDQHHAVQLGTEAFFEDTLKKKVGAYRKKLLGSPHPGGGSCGEH